MSPHRAQRRTSTVPEGSPQRLDIHRALRVLHSVAGLDWIVGERISCPPVCLSTVIRGPSGTIAHPRCNLDDEQAD